MLIFPNLAENHDYFSQFHWYQKFPKKVRKSPETYYLPRILSGPDMTEQLLTGMLITSV